MISLGNIWQLFSLIVSVTAPFWGTLTGLLVARLFSVLLINGFFSIVRDAALNLIKKGV